MGQEKPPRVMRSGPFVPTLPRTGDDFPVIWRKSNMVTRGREGKFYEENFSGLGDLNEPLNLVALTGTLEFTAGSTTVTGAGTAFFDECHLGQFIVAIKDDNSWLLVVRRIDADDSMVVWKAPGDTVSGVTGFRASSIWAVNDQRGTGLTGDALKLDRGSYVSAGSGEFQVNGAPLQGSSLTMTRAPQISLFDAATGNYTNFTLGMDTPTAPTATAVGGGSKMQAGNYSVVITPARKETGGYNNPSERADVTIATNDVIRITFPAMDTTNGQNAWKVWVTTYADNLGADLNYLNGPWHYLVMVDDTQVSPAGGDFDFQWYDAEVENNEIVSFNNDPPTDAEFVASMNAVLIYISCQGQGNPSHPTATSPGPFIVPSKPNNIEAAPLDLAFSSSPPETIIGVVTAQGRLYLLTYNHLQIAQSTPSDAVPIIIRPFWKDGFANRYQLVFVNGTLYGFPVAGPSRSVGDGDEIVAERDWAEDVAEIILGDRSIGNPGWNPGQVLVGYDPFNDGVVFFHSGDSLNDAGFWRTRWLMFGISQNAWISHGYLSSDTKDSIVSGVATVGDRLDLIIGGRTGTDAGSSTTERFDAGEGTPWFITPPVVSSGLRDDIIKAVRVQGKLTAAHFMVYKWGPNEVIDVDAIDAGTGSATGAMALADTTGVALSKRYQINVKNAMEHTIRVDGDCTDTGRLDRVDLIEYERAQMGARR